jgi:hypothetical protein
MPKAAHRVSVLNTLNRGNVVMPAKLTDLLIESNAMGRTTLPWALRYLAPRASAAVERVRLDEHGLSVAGIARFNISP